MATVELYSTETGNNASNEFSPNAPLANHVTTKVLIQINGTSDGETVSLQAKDTNDAWHDTTDIIPVPSVKEIEYTNELRLRLNISGAGASTSISAWAKNATA